MTTRVGVLIMIGIREEGLLWYFQISRSDDFIFPLFCGRKGLNVGVSYLCKILTVVIYVGLICMVFVAAFLRYL